MPKNAKEIVTLDCETDPFERGKLVKPFVWGSYCKSDGFLWFRKESDVIHYLSRKKAIVYAHNGGKFDFLFLLDYFEPRKEIRVINGRIAQFSIGLSTFRDSFLILPIPLKDYKKDKMDYSDMRADRRENPRVFAGILKYLEADCVYLHELVSKFKKTYGDRLTLASSAMKFWSDLSGIKAPDTPQSHFDKFKPFYYGGRVQCFRPGVHKNTPIKVYDINSAYPFAMTQRHPWGELVDNGDTLPDDPSELARSFIHLKARSMGAFPFLDGDGLAFPDDGRLREFRVTGWEYIAAQETGCLKDAEILGVIRLTQSIEFGSYVSHFYKLKSESEKGSPDYIFAKLMLNSLYGKFGANPSKYKRFHLCEPRFVRAHESRTDFKWLDWVGNWALMGADLPEGQRRFYNVATAASITGCVRAFLWKGISEADTPYYCDTDGLHCLDAERLPLSKRLGDWNIEFEATDAAYGGKKLYALLQKKPSGRLVAKKISSKGARLTASQVFRIAAGATVHYTQKAPSMSVRRGFKVVTREINATF